MDLEGIRLNKISQRKTNTVPQHLCVRSKKYNKLVNIILRKQQTYMIPIDTGNIVVTSGRGKGGGAI